MMIALNLNTLTLTGTHNNTHTLLHAHTHTKYMFRFQCGCVVIGDYFSPQYTSNCLLNDMIRLWSDGAPDQISPGLCFLLQLTAALNPTLTPISPTFIRESLGTAVLQQLIILLLIGLMRQDKYGQRSNASPSNQYAHSKSKERKGGREGRFFFLFHFDASVTPNNDQSNLSSIKGLLQSVSVYLIFSYIRPIQRHALKCGCWSV